jgi:two-component system CheB/CheR fusion protein
MAKQDSDLDFAPLEPCRPALAEPEDPFDSAPEFDEARCKALMRVLTSIVWVADPEGNFRSVQPSWSAYTGQSWPEQEGFGWLDAVHPEDVEGVRSRFELARQTSTCLMASGRLWHAATRSWRHCEARGVPILSSSGQVQEWVGTCKDVEDRRRAEEILRDADRRKDEFIAVLAHELRNPLAPIRNAIHVLKMRGNDDMQLTWLRSIIERQVGHMAHLLEDLLDISRIRQNKIELRKSRVTLDSILGAAMELSRPFWEQNGQRFELNVLAGPIYVEADPPRLIQVVSNLLNNAAKYTDRGGRIALTVSVQDNQAVISVRDDGIGISPELMPKLFQIFTQDRPSLERSQGGLGIGLSIVRALVEMHGGTVEARSEGLGRGSEFIVRLPTAGRRMPFQPNGGAPVARPAGERMKILVADDNQDAAETLSVFLEMLGYKVRLASDGEEALRIAETFLPDVALLDIGMPKLDGYQVADRLRASAPAAVLIAITGWGQPGDVQRAVAAGFQHHLVKPVDPERLQQLLTESACVRAQTSSSTAL